MDKKRVFNKLYRDNIGFVVYYCQNRFNFDKSTAEDISQMVFLKAHDKFETLKDIRRFRSWILTIARNEAVSHIRRIEKTVPYDETVLHTDNSFKIDGLVKKLEIQLINDFLLCLPEGVDNEILRDFYVKGRNLNEIADKHKLKVTNVTTKLSRLRQKFKSQLLSKITELRERCSGYE